MPRSARALAFPALVLAAYAWLFPWIPALRSPNELARLYQARAIVEDHSLSVNHQITRHGVVGDLSVRDGRMYPNKAPGVSFLGAAVFLAVRAAHGGRAVAEATALFWLRLVVCMVPGALAAELLRRLLRRRFDPALATAGALTFALGTIQWPYSTFLMSHGPTAAAVIASWWALTKAQERSADPPGGHPLRWPAWNAWWTLAGFLAGWAVLLEYTSALALPPLLLTCLRGRTADSSPRVPCAAAAPRSAAAVLASRGGGGEGVRRAILAGALGFLPPILLLAFYHQAAFGHPLHTGYRHLVNPVFTEWHARGFLGVGAPSLRALAGSFLDPARGLFAWCPFLALGVPGLALLARRDRALALLCAGELALYSLFTASFTYQAWGWVVGPRHITTLCAFLIPPALAAAEWLRERALGFVAAGLALSGMAALALTLAVCPYLPEELTNPLWQLVVPLAREGFRSTDLLGLALHERSPWTLAPWVALLAAAASWTVLRLTARRVGSGRPLLAAAVALALLVFQSRLGGPDRFEHTRRFLAERMELMR